MGVLLFVYIYLAYCIPVARILSVGLHFQFLARKKKKSCLSGRGRVLERKKNRNKNCISGPYLLIAHVKRQPSDLRDLQRQSPRSFTQATSRPTEALKRPKRPGRSTTNREKKKRRPGTLKKEAFYDCTMIVVPGTSTCWGKDIPPGDIYIFRTFRRTA